MANNTLWVHGNAAQFQDLSGVTNVSYGGPGLTGQFVLGSSAWVHIPLPTPTVLNGEDAELAAVHLELQLGWVSMDSIAIYDGPNQIYAAADAYFDVTFSPAKKITYGVGVSVHLVYQHGGDDENIHPPQQIVIGAAGGEYAYPNLITVPIPTPKKPQP